MNSIHLKTNKKKTPEGKENVHETQKKIRSMFSINVLQNYESYLISL